MTECETKTWMPSFPAKVNSYNSRTEIW